MLEEWPREARVPFLILGDEVRDLFDQLGGLPKRADVDGSRSSHVCSRQTLHGGWHRCGEHHCLKEYSHRFHSNVFSCNSLTNANTYTVHAVN